MPIISIHQKVYILEEKALKLVKKALLKRNFLIEFKHQFIDLLERALRALASSSGGAACPGATGGQPQGSTPGVRE